MSSTEEKTAAPGLKWRTRGDGSRVPYWCPRSELVKQGYRPKTVRLHYEANDPALADRCRALQAEMLAWAGDQSGKRYKEEYDGTFASLVRIFETHEDSPIHEVGEATQRTYSKTMALLMNHKGKRRVDKVKGIDVKRWYKELIGASPVGWAYFTINVLKVVLSFGASLRFADCALLRNELQRVRFNAGPRRTEVITAKQVAVFVDKAREMSFDWMARCVLLQFEFAMRRRDVIGEYVTDDGGNCGIRQGRKVWRDGLIWADIDKNGIVRRIISKTRRKTKAQAVHAIADYPMVGQELARTPPEQRIGPLVICHITGQPPTEAQCRRFFRIIARQAGIPDKVWNMDARAGANSEADEAGATQEERMAMSTHSTQENSEPTGAR